MVSRLDTEAKVVGIKQVKRAIESQEVAIVYIAEDADEVIIDEVVGLCKDTDIQIIHVNSMEELGKSCGIDVKAATAALLREVK